MTLSDIPLHQLAYVETVEAFHGNDAIARRLCELGFVAGEPVRVIACGPIGKEPLLVQIGHSRFALRRTEAARVHVVVEAEEHVA